MAASIKSIKLLNTVRTVPITDIWLSSRAIGAVSATNNEADKTITVATSSDATNGDAQLGGSALFPPQTVTNDFIEVTTNYGTTKFSTNKAFSGGTEYKVSLHITRQMIGFTSTITDWTADNGTITVPPGSSAGLSIANIRPQEYTGEEMPVTIYVNVGEFLSPGTYHAYIFTEGTMIGSGNLTMEK